MIRREVWVDRRGRAVRCSLAYINHPTKTNISELISQAGLLGTRSLYNGPPASSTRRPTIWYSPASTMRMAWE
jgi:hypothetical protein